MAFRNGMMGGKEMGGAHARHAPSSQPLHSLPLKTQSEFSRGANVVAEDAEETFICLCVRILYLKGMPGWLAQRWWGTHAVIDTVPEVLVLTRAVGDNLLQQDIVRHEVTGDAEGLAEHQSRSG